MARSFRRLSGTTTLAMCCAAAVGPAPAAAQEQPQSTLDSVAAPLLAVPAATLPGLTRALTPADPSRPSDSASGTGTVAPQAYIKDRVELRTFRGTVVSVYPQTAQIVVKVTRRHKGRTTKRRQIFGLSGARLEVADSNGDGVSGIADILRGDQVRLRAAIGRGPLRSAVPLAVRDLVDKGQPVRSKRRGRRLR